MKDFIRVRVDTVESHLRANRTAVPLPLTKRDYQAFRVTLDADDVPRIVLWWQNEQETTGLTCRLIHSTLEAGNKTRVERFINGDSKLGYGPADLRTLPNKEPVAVTDDLNSDFWYLIDGSHRTIAQYRSGKTFENVPIYVCVHPDIMTWEYIPRIYKGLKRVT